MSGSVTSVSENGIHSSWEDWLQPQYWHPTALKEIRARVASTPAQLILLRDFLNEERARRIELVLARNMTWRTEFAARLPNDDVELISRPEWDALPARRRHHKQQIWDIKCIEMNVETQPIREFLHFLVNRFSNWVSDILGFPVQQKPSIEIAKYLKYDFIGPHADLHDEGRVLGANFYFSRGWRLEAGGRLGLRNESGDEHFVNPLFNSLSLLPVRCGCSHWVEEVKRGRFPRFTVSTAYRRLNQNRSK